MKLKAFTLAEVMIVLGILGVIATVTIPTINARTEEARFIAQLHKAENTLQNAIKMAALDNDNLPINHWKTVSEATSQTEKNIAVKNALMRNLNVVNDCSVPSQCLGLGNYKTLKKNATTYLDQAVEAGIQCFMTSDGITFCYDTGLIHVDLNGPQKPNTFGVDTFQFGTNANNTVRPYGYNDGNFEIACSINNDNEKNGVACAAWALHKGNMDYRRKTVNW